MKLNKYCVYALWEGGRIRYIGMTRRALDARLRQHLYEAKAGRSLYKKIYWLRKCMSEGRAVYIKPIRSSLSLERAEELEIQIIKKLRGSIVNSHAGGRLGFNGLPDETKLRIASGLLRWREKRAAGLIPPPYRKIEWCVRNKKTGEMVRNWNDLVSVRHAAKALGLILKYCG